MSAVWLRRMVNVSMDGLLLKQLHMARPFRYPITPDKFQRMHLFKRDHKTTKIIDVCVSLTGAVEVFLEQEDVAVEDRPVTEVLEEVMARYKGTGWKEDSEFNTDLPPTYMQTSDADHPHMSNEERFSNILDDGVESAFGFSP